MSSDDSLTREEIIAKIVNTPAEPFSEPLCPTPRAQRPTGTNLRSGKGDKAEVQRVGLQQTLSQNRDQVWDSADEWNAHLFSGEAPIGGFDVEEELANVLSAEIEKEMKKIDDEILEQLRDLAKKFDIPIVTPKALETGVRGHAAMDTGYFYAPYVPMVDYISVLKPEDVHTEAAMLKLIKTRYYVTTTKERVSPVEPQKLALMINKEQFVASKSPTSPMHSSH